MQTATANKEEDRAAEKPLSKAQLYERIGATSESTGKRWLRKEPIATKLDEIQPGWRSDKVFTARATKFLLSQFV